MQGFGGFARNLPTAEAEALRRQRERAAAHARQCRALPPLRQGEAAALMQAFLARGGAVTTCPPRFALPTAAAV